MIWPSRAVPSVIATIAWVSPRVNSAEPCTRGSPPVFTVIGRTVTRSRPSMRVLVRSTLARIELYSSSLNSLPRSAVFQPASTAFGFSDSTTSFFSFEIASRRSILSFTE